MTNDKKIICHDCKNIRNHDRHAIVRCADRFYLLSNNAIIALCDFHVSRNGIERGSKSVTIEEYLRRDKLQEFT